MQNNTFRIELLGTPRVLKNGELLDISRKRVRAILFYLAGENKPIPRTTLAWMFWPDKSPQVASRNLSIHVSYLKNALCEAAITTTQGALQLADFVQTDVADYLRLSQSDAEGDAQAAYELFRGTFLEGFSIKDAEPFDQWSSTEADVWRSRAVDTALEYSYALESSGATGDALACVQRSIAANPIREDLYRRAMRLMEKAGMRAQVGELYQHLTAQLNDELGLPPALQTVECYQTIIGSNENFTASVLQTGKHALKVDDMPFIGRDEEIERVRGCAPGKLLLVNGESGMGKTRLLREIPRSTDERRMTITFTQQAHEMPFGAVIDAIKEFSTQSEWPQLARRAPRVIGSESWSRLRCLVPTLDANPETVASTFALSSAQAQETVEEFLKLLSLDAPLHVVCDDLHNADDSSLECLERMITRTAPANIRYTAAMNPAMADARCMSFLNDLQRHARLEAITLHKIDDARMMDALLFYYPDIDDETAGKLIALADGNPYWMNSIIQGLDSGYTEFSGKASLENLFDFTLQSLSAQALQVADALAVCNGPCEGEVFAQLCDERHCEAILAELTAAGLARRDRTGRIVLRNSRMQEYLLARLSREPRRLESIHLRIARAMEELYADAPASMQDIAICQHLSHSTHPTECGAYAAKAGDYLLQVDDIEAAMKYYKLAVKHLQGAEKLDASLILYINMTHAGQLYEADLYLQSAMSIAKSQGREDYVLTLQAARKIEAIPEYTEVRAGVIPCYARQIDPEIRNMLMRADELAAENGASLTLIGYILGFLSSWYMIAGRFEESIECLNRIVGFNLCQKPENNASSSMSIFFSALVTLIALMKDKPDPRIHNLIAIEEDAFKETPIRSFSSSSEGIKSMRAYILGDRARGDEIAEKAIELYEKSGNEPMLAAMLVTKATMQHATEPTKAYLANYEAYRISKKIGANYSLIRSLIGLVVTSPTKSEAISYLTELRELASSVGDARLYDRIANIASTVKNKPE